MKLLVCLVLVFLVEQIICQIDPDALLARIVALEQSLQNKCKQIDSNTANVQGLMNNCRCAPKPKPPPLTLPIDCKGNLKKCGLKLLTGGKGIAKFNKKGAFVHLVIPVNFKPSDFATVQSPPINQTGPICVQAFAQVSTPNCTLAPLVIFSGNSVNVKLPCSKKFVTTPTTVAGSVNPTPVGCGLGAAGPPAPFTGRRKRTNDLNTVIRVRFNRFLITPGPCNTTQG